LVAELRPVLADLQAESADVDALVSGLADPAWATPTPAEGWTIAHQIAHLAWTDEAAVLAVTDPRAFTAKLRQALAMGDLADDAAAERAALAPAELLAGWRDGRSVLADTLLAAPERSKIAWFGAPMSATSMATARLMETWAHGQDVADALGVTRAPTSRLRHVAHIGIRTRDFAFLMHDRTPPGEPFRIELSAPDGGVWRWGEEAASQSVSGPALDFCLLVTQRRHRYDLSLVAVGADADTWLDIAQAFAGPPGRGRAPGQFSA
jgi:uncharacterized protein (TIGR03084 family)